MQIHVKHVERQKAHDVMCATVSSNIKQFILFQNSITQILGETYEADIAANCVWDKKDYVCSEIIACLVCLLQLHISDKQ